MKKYKPFITGLNGCQCHPFDSWEDCAIAHKYLFKIGQQVVHRWTGIKGRVFSCCGQGNYYVVAFGPKQSDKVLTHAAMLEVTAIGKQMKIF